VFAADARGAGIRADSSRACAAMEAGDVVGKTLQVVD
jgi:hypothetical protein